MNICTFPMHSVKEQRKPSIIKDERSSKTNPDTDASLTDQNEEIDTLTGEQIDEFFKATEDGSVERLERLFSEIKIADPNMTRFDESLLMAAIRRQRYEVAEYLIDQLGVDVGYGTDLHEFRFRTKNPIRQRKYTCRDLAYEKGMMDIVDLIDITSDEVEPSVKRYLRKRLQSRLDAIHRNYLSRIKETSKSPMMLPSDNNDNRQLPVLNVNNTKTLQQPPVLPRIKRLQKSQVEQAVKNIDATLDKSIDVTGKKTFRFSNYNLRFRLIETEDKNIKSKEQARLKPSSIPALPLIRLPPSPLPSSTTNSCRRSVSEMSTRLSMRESCAAPSHSVLRTTIPELTSIENKSPFITATPPKNILPKRIHHPKIKPKYVPQPHDSSYNQPRHFLPVTLKATAIGLPTDTRLIRD